MSPRHCENYTTDRHPHSDVTRPGVDLLQHNLLSQRAAHPRPARVRCSLEEDRRVHTCGPEPRGALL